jgi:hypothetical protein
MTEVMLSRTEIDGALEPWASSGALLAANAGIYLSLRQDDPELAKASILPYCQDIVANVPEGRTALIVGGLPIDVFNHEGTSVEPTELGLSVSDAFKSLLLRPNKTIRDYDVLEYKRLPSGALERVDDAEQKQLKSDIAQAASERAATLNQPAPPVSVFSFDKKASLVHSATVLGDDGKVHLVHGLIDQPLPTEALEPWSISLSDGTVFNSLSPWEQYWRSMVRFTSGAKVKDLTKLATMYAKLRTTDGLAELEDSELCMAYNEFYMQMRAQNTFAAIREVALQRPNGLTQALKLSKYVLASQVLAAGQKIPAVERIVQGAPKVFNVFVGSK